MKSQRLFGGAPIFSEGQLAKAQEMMKALGFSNGYIASFLDNPRDFPGEFFSAACSRFLKGKIAFLQETFGCLVYYVTHERTYFGECYSFLYVSKYSEDWPIQSVKSVGDKSFIVHAYVWNVTMEHNSEFGSILVERGEDGQLYRVG